MTADIKRAIGERIRKAREEQNLTQGQLADRLGKTSKAISSYETGISMLRADEMYALAHALNKPLMYFYLQEFQTIEITRIALQLDGYFLNKLEEAAVQLLEMQTKFNSATADLLKTGIILGTGESVSDFLKRTEDEETDGSDD